MPKSLNQHPAVRSCYSCLWESPSQFTCPKQWQTVEVPFSCIKGLNPLRHLVIWPLDHNQVLMTLITNAMESCDFYVSGTCLSPQKRVDVAWGKLERDRWGSALLGVGGRKLLGGMRTGSANQWVPLYTSPSLVTSGFTSCQVFSTLGTMTFDSLTAVERVLKNKCSLFCPAMSPLDPDLRHLQDVAYVISMYGVSFRKKQMFGGLTVARFVLVFVGFIFSC